MLTPAEYRQAAEAAKRDVLFAEEEEAEAEDEAIGAEAVAGAMISGGQGTSKLTFAGELRRKDLEVGTRVLAAVADISSQRMIMQLAGRIEGRVGVEEISDEVHAMAQSGENKV